ncbi:MAG TPA: RagB/SusD family nutrient uptake outer membrane protein [Puia sp.]|nr:RagB/SusD family nutrient uptake outer membrane protein [Puia sp.]
MPTIKALCTMTGAALVLLMCSCTKTFLDLDPQDQATEAVYFKTPDQFKAAANDFYNKMIGFRPLNSSNIYNWMDWGSDLLNPGYGWPSSLNASDIYWNNTYSYIRANNILIAKGAEYTGDYSGIKQYVAAACFFRAWHHFFLLKRYGGIPIDTIVADVKSPLLSAPRNSRYEVTRQILSDLDVAIDGLPLEGQIAAADKGQVSKQAAMAFKARVELYEGTYEKYVGKDTDGDGTSSGAGSKGYDPANVNSYLTDAASLSQQVMSYSDYSLFTGVDSLSYRYLFILDDAASNPKGLTKTANKEFILASKYDYTLLQGNANLTHTGGGGISRKLMDMFLCKDGLPYSVSPLAKGYASMTDEFDNRESRMTCITGAPKQKYWGFSSAFGANYTLANYFTLFDWPSYINISYPDLSNGGSGYGSRKWSSESANRNDYQESYDYPQIRLAEVYLTYAEAKCELGNGAISDDDLNISINKIRARAGAAPLTNALIAPYPSLTMLGEIRRERTLELLSENTRFTDLFRWGIAEQELNQVPEGMVVQYQGQPTEIATFTNPYTNKPAYNPSTYPFGVDAVTGALILSGPPNVPMTKKNYLTSIPQDQITLNAHLLQNPGY